MCVIRMKPTALVCGGGGGSRVEFEPAELESVREKKNKTSEPENCARIIHKYRVIEVDSINSG